MSIRTVAAVACGGMVLGVAQAACAQIAVNASNVVVDFASFSGTGIVAAPSVGQLSSLAWSLSGLSDGNLDFGANGTSGDFARGASPGGVQTGGIYAFDTGGGHVVLGIQPTDVDFTPGSLTARFKNALARPLLSIDVSYKIWVFADEAHSSSFDFSWSPDNVTFTSVPALDFTSYGPIPTTPEWRSYDEATTLALNVPPGGYLFLRWTSDDAGGSGGRDELGLDAITLNVNAVCGDGYVEGSEACDDGNQNNTDGCLTSCVLPRCGDGYLEQGVEQCEPTLGSVDPTCCSSACLFTAGNTCAGGICQAGQCVPSVAGAGGGGTAGSSATAGGSATAGSGGTSPNGGASSPSGGEAGEGGAAGEVARGGTAGIAQGGALGHAGKGARPPRAGSAGTGAADGGNNATDTGGTSALGGSSGTHASATGGTSTHPASGGTGGTAEPETGGASETDGAPEAGGTSEAAGTANGGRSAPNGGKAGTAGASSSAPAADSGCSCSVPRRSSTPALRVAAGLAVLALSRIRRRSRRHLKT